MLRLGTLGGVTLSRDGTPLAGVAANSARALAFLALLAVAGERGMTREALAALFWPGSEPGAARHSLDQLLLAVRRQLGRDVLSGTSTLRLDPACLTSDVAAFEEALRAGRLEQAAALYRGPFADGLVVKGAPEVERRLDAARAGFAREHAALVERLARAAAERGDQAGCARWWQRLADADPLNARAARELVAALVAAGEPARALRHALVHEALVRQEGVVPDAAVLQWIGRLRAPAAVAGRGAPAGAVAAPTRGDVATFADGAHVAAQQRRLALLAGMVGQRYRVGELVEEGAITAVFAARATDDAGAAVELHLVQPRVAAGAAAGRFLDAMRRAMALSHAAILPVLDVVATRDALLFVTAARPRATLRDRLRRERALPVATALAVGRDVAAALAAAHAHGVRHGDLRPKHVGLAPEAAMVAGLGVVEGVTSTADDTGHSTIVALGSPTYLSPEQLAGEVQADARSDVYALGCILYEMLAGEPPFGRRSHGAQLRHKLTQPPPPLRTLRESVPIALEEVVHRCLARTPADRYADGGALARALGELLPSVHSTPAGPP